MLERKRLTTRLKELFERPDIFVLAGGMNPIGARMAEVLGYEAFYMSGGNTSAHQLGWPDSGTSMRDMVDNARKIVLTVDIPVFADADTGYGDAIGTYYTVREYIRAGVGGIHIEDQVFPPKSGARRRCISIKEMVGKLRAAMDAKLELDPDFVIMARCDLGGVPGASLSEIIERCIAYKEEAKVDVVCPNNLRTWDEITEAIRRIPGLVVPLLPATLSPYPSLQEQQTAGAAAAWFPALTTMAGLQANWDFLSDFKARGTLALDAFRAQAATSPWGVASNGHILGEQRLREMEDKYLPNA
jgi:2-methylisocitrate lyase-like PEP mutase family enzyme